MNKYIPFAICALVAGVIMIFNFIFSNLQPFVTERIAQLRLKDYFIFQTAEIKKNLTYWQMYVLKSLGILTEI